MRSVATGVIPFGGDLLLADLRVDGLLVGDLVLFQPDLLDRDGPLVDDGRLLVEGDFLLVITEFCVRRAAVTGDRLAFDVHLLVGNRDRLAAPAQ